MIDTDDLNSLSVEELRAGIALQRKEIDRLRARVASLSKPTEGEDIMVNTPYDVFILPLRPSGLSSGPRFVVHVPGPEQPAPAEGLGEREHMDEIMCDVPGLAAAVWEEREREEFEAWFSDGWQHPKAVERDAAGYKLAAAQNAWTAWQAGWCAALAAQQQEKGND